MKKLVWQNLEPEEWGKLAPFYRPPSREELDVFNKTLGKNDDKFKAEVEIVYRWFKDKDSQWFFRIIKKI